MLLQFLFVVVDTVPLLYGAPVETGIGTTVAVLKITTGPVLEAGDTSFSLPPEAAAPELAVAAAGEAVSVYEIT